MYDFVIIAKSVYALALREMLHILSGISLN